MPTGTGYNGDISAISVGAPASRDLGGGASYRVDKHISGQFNRDTQARREFNELRRHFVGKKPANISDEDIELLQEYKNLLEKYHKMSSRECPLFNMDDLEKEYEKWIGEPKGKNNHSATNDICMKMIQKTR